MKKYHKIPMSVLAFESTGVQKNFSDIFGAISS